MSVSAARASLPRVLDLVSAGEEVTITRNGHPVAVLVRPEALRVRRAGEAFAAAASISDLLRQGRDEDILAASGLSADRAEELAVAVRAARQAR